MDLEDLLRGLSGHGQLAHLERILARAPVYADPEKPLPPLVAERFPRLWCHQAEAIDHVRHGRHCVVATGTASGKSACFQIPIAAAAMEAEAGGPAATALLLYPTKALAQDQLRAFGELDLPGLVAATYDGDTDGDTRRWVQRHANVVLTNPDMLHAGILPSHGRWATFLMRLQFVVIDELHSLRGIFGTHVAHLVRRLRRLCAHYGADPTFVFCSATLGQPERLAESVLGEPVHAVTIDGSPRGERLFALWNPPLLDERSGARASGSSETAALLAGLVADGHRAIAFTRSRKGAEVVALRARERLPAQLQTAVRSYRGGYLATERREIESLLFSGELRGVSATNALELGIDVGGLDACVLNGFPGTIASMWQQAGRAGRTSDRSLAVLVAGEDALDQWLVAHPREVFTRSPEPAVVNPANPNVLDPHLACAAYELPLRPDDDRFWGDDLDDGVRRLALDDVLRLRDGRAVYGGSGRPSHAVGLRTGSSSEYRIVDDDGTMIGTVDESRAFLSVHEGAVYLHQGQHYRVERLDLEDRAAWVRPVDPEEMTQARSDTDVRVIDDERSVAVGRARLHLGAVEVSHRVTGYRRTSLLSGEPLGDVELDLPPTSLMTRAFWYTVDHDVLAAGRISESEVPGTLHAAEHAAIGMLPLFTICDRWDVGGLSTPLQMDTGLPTIVIYDGYPGGAGIAELGFEAGRSHLAATLEAIAACQCDGGCPSCVQSPKCGNLNDPLDKAGAARLLRAVIRTDRPVWSRRGR